MVGSGVSEETGHTDTHALGNPPPSKQHPLATEATLRNLVLTKPHPKTGTGGECDSTASLAGH